MDTHIAWHQFRMSLLRALHPLYFAVCFGLVTAPASASVNGTIEIRYEHAGFAYAGADFVENGLAVIRATSTSSPFVESPLGQLPVSVTHQGGQIYQVTIDTIGTGYVRGASMFYNTGLVVVNGVLYLSESGGSAVLVYEGNHVTVEMMISSPFAVGGGGGGDFDDSQIVEKLEDLIALQGSPAFATESHLEAIRENLWLGGSGTQRSTLGRTEDNVRDIRDATINTIEPFAAGALPLLENIDLTLTESLGDGDDPSGVGIATFSPGAATNAPIAPAGGDVDGWEAPTGLPTPAEYELDFTAATGPPVWSATFDATPVLQAIGAGSMTPWNLTLDWSFYDGTIRTLVHTGVIAFVSIVCAKYIFDEFRRMA